MIERIMFWITFAALLFAFSVLGAAAYQGNPFAGVAAFIVLLGMLAMGAREVGKFP